MPIANRNPIRGRRNLNITIANAVISERTEDFLGLGFNFILFVADVWDDVLIP
jgi:hypothetical protein